MTTTSNPINVTSGQNVIDQSVIPYIRAQRVEFTAHNLKPYSLGQMYFDDVNVTRFCQVSSILTTNVGYAANNFVQGEGLFCPQTCGYANVIMVSQDNNIYINENFTTINLTPYGPLNSNSFSATDYLPGDIVYFATNTSSSFLANTYVGRVVYWASANGALTMVPMSGTVSGNAQSNPILYKTGSSKIANLINVVYGDKFPKNAVIKSTSNASKTFLANTYTHRSGYIVNASGLATQLFISGNVSNNVVNSTVFLTGGTGVGQNSKIISVSNSAGRFSFLNINPGVTINAIGNTTYSIGAANVDEIGCLAGVFNIPEDNSVKFQTGQRLFTINDKPTVDDPDAEMKAYTQFVAQGFINSTINVRQTPVVPPVPVSPPKSNTNIVPSTPTARAVTVGGTNFGMRGRWADPVAQTFFTPQPKSLKTDYGIFVTSVNLFFQSKPVGNSTKFPVQCKIVKTDNGYPTETVMAIATVQWADVKVADGINTFPDSNKSSTYTKFTFEDPVYLDPNTEYALVVYSESPDYQVWIAELGQPIINSNRIVSHTPYTGSFFRSQNASTWTPYQNEQLMFVINKAFFSTAPLSLVYNVTTPVQNTLLDLALLHSTDITFPVANISYGLKTVIANSGVQDSNFVNIENNQPYNFGNDLQNSSATSNRRRVIQAGNANSCLLQINMSTTDHDVSPMFNSERLSMVGLTNVINAGQLSNSQITITSGGAHINAANIVVTIDAPTGMSGTGIQATANVLPAGLVAGNVVAINFINNGSGYVVSPNITITEAAATSNASVTYNGEDKKFGGNGATRYVSRVITLADGFDAGDLQIFMQAIRPQGTDIQVYYKVVSGSDFDPISNKNWKQMMKQFDVFSPDQVTPIQLNFNSSTDGVSTGSLSYTENNVVYPLGGKFKSFAIKIVLFANDPTVPPLVQNYRAIAVPSG